MPVFKLVKEPEYVNGETIVPVSDFSFFGNSPVTDRWNLNPFCRDLMYFWGNNEYGQLTDPFAISTANAISIAAYDHTAIVAGDKRVYAWGKNDYGQCNVPVDLENVKKVVAGSTFTIALKEDGTVVGWGNDGLGQSIVPSGLTDVVNIAAGDNHTLAIKSDRSLVAWGSNFFGQCGIPFNFSKRIFNIAAGGDNSAVIFTDGTIQIWGGNLFGNLNVPFNLKDVVALSMKNSHTLALTKDGKVRGWGDNDYGQITIPLDLEKVKKVAAGTNYSMALLYNGHIVTWGDNTYNQLPIPINLEEYGQASDVTAGNFHNIAISCSFPPPTPPIWPTRTPTPTPTITKPTPTPTRTPTVTPNTPTPTPTNTPTITVTKSLRPTRTPTPTNTPTRTRPANTPTPSVTRRPQPSPFRPPVAPPGFEDSLLPNQYGSNTLQLPTPTPTRQPLPTPTSTPTITPTNRTPTPTPTITRTRPTPTPTPTITPSINSFKSCAYPVFVGFTNQNNRYTTITIYNWDSCINTGNANDGIFDKSNYFTPPPWRVDGHVTLVAITATTGVIRDVTGKFYTDRYPLNSLHTISSFINLNSYPNIVSDTVANSNIYDVNCNDPDGLRKFVHLSNDYSRNCVPFGIDGPVNSVYYDNVDNKIYAVGSFSNVNSNPRSQVARFNYSGTHDSSFNVNQNFNGNPFDVAPNDIRRINDSIYISNLQKYSTTPVSNLTFNAQGAVTSHIHKVNLDGLRDTDFTQFTFTNNKPCIDYVSVSNQNLLILANERMISFRSSINNSQAASNLNGTEFIQGIVAPNVDDPNVVYILQRINGGLDPTSNPKAIKAINTTTRTLDLFIHGLLAGGLNSMDTAGYTKGSLSPNGDFMILERSYSNNNMSPSFWNTGIKDFPILTKVFPTQMIGGLYTAPTNSSQWNAFGNFITSNNSGKTLIDSFGNIYLLLLNENPCTFSNIQIRPYSFIRLFHDGTLDLSFDVMGNLNPSGKIYGAALISDDEIIICGDFTSYNNNATKQYLVKIDSVGRPI